MPNTVLVTGVTGFLGAHICKTLIDKGYNVRGTVRKLGDKSRYEFLHDVCGDADKTRISFVEAELNSGVDVWEQAAKDCVACIHSAAPVVLASKNPQKELVDPILVGIANIFGGCEKAGTVKKLVYTGSLTSVSVTFPEWKTHVYGPSDWNTDSTLKTGPYPFAKLQGEKAAHAFVKERKCFSLAVVLPNAIMGPLLQPGKPKTLPETMDLPIRGSLEGDMWKINYNFGIADVRDVAAVHVAAMEHLPTEFDENAPIPRYIVSDPVVGFGVILKELAKCAPERKHKLPKVPIPTSLALLYMRLFYEKGVYNYVKGNIGRTPKFDTSLVENELKITLRPLSETIKDIVEWLRSVHAAGL